MSPEDSFEKKFFFQKMCFFSIILGLRAFSFKTSGQKNSCNVSKLHPTCPKNRYFEEEQFLEKPISFLFLFGPWNKTFLTFVEKIAAGLPNLHASSPKELLEENKAWKSEKFFCLSQTLSEKLSDVGKTFFGCVLLPAYYIPIKKVLDFFPEVQGPTLTNLDFLKKKFGRFFKTAFYRAERIVIRNVHFFFKKKVFFFPTFQEMELKILEFGLQKVSSVTKLPFDAPSGIFWAEQCL